MTATTTVTGSPDKAPTAVPPRRRGSLLSKIAAPYKQSHGVQRFMLVSGTVGVAAVHPDGDLRAADRAVQLRHLPGRAGPLPDPGRADRPQPLGHDGAGLRRHVAHDLRRAHGGRGRRSWRSSSRSPSACRSGSISGFVGGWLDRILVLIMDALFAFPYLLLAIVAAFLLVGHDRQRHRRHRDRDHRRLRAAVLPGGASIDAVGARSHLHRGGTRHGRAARARSSASTCSAT